MSLERDSGAKSILMFNVPISQGLWAAKSAMYYEEIAWMPIPSFDEILEANRDVLERIKEKGD